MYPSRSYITFPHRVDLYKKTSVRNDMGQDKGLWSIDVVGQECSYVPSTSSTAIRVTPTIEEADYFTVFFPHDAAITYSTRLKDLKIAPYNEMIDDRFMQVIQIDKHIGFSGRVQHLQVRLKTVIE